MSELTGCVVDVHCHVGLRGDRWPELGMLSERFIDSPAAKGFLMYSRISANDFTDPVIRDATERLLSETAVDRVICLALDWVHDDSGRPRPDLTNMFVSHEYIRELRTAVGDKVLLGASVHPYAADFGDRVKEAVDSGAVLLKWLPSAQNINLADPRTGAALRDLAHLGPNGNAVPLLLHTGAEYAVPPVDERSASLDFHSWSRWDRFWNLFRGRTRWRTPDVAGVARNIRGAVEEGAIVIFAHCGLPYFAARSRWLEHSDFRSVRDYLSMNADLPEGSGAYYADVSACCTPFRQSYFSDLADLPAEQLLFGSDFPTPVFELSANPTEVWDDFRAVLRGQFERIIVPQDNLLDVNHRELETVFAGHPMFTNFGALWDRLCTVSDRHDMTDH